MTVFTLCGPCLATAGAQGSRMVVVLYPHNSDGSPGNALVNQSVRSILANHPAENIEIYDEFLDVSHPKDDHHEQFQVEYMRRKYAGRRVDLVITCLSSGLDFALENRQEIFPAVPIVYCGVDQWEVTFRKLPSGVVGIPMKVDLAGTLDLALRLHPNTQRVAVVAGNARMDAAWEREARRVFQPYETKLEFIYLTGLTMEDLLKRVSNLPERSIIYYLHVFQDATGRAFFPANALELLAQKATVPIYGLAAFLVFGISDSWRKLSSSPFVARGVI